MSRYFTKPRSAYCEDEDDYVEFGPLQPAFTVHEDELETWTGLLDASGQEIHRSERIRMGFNVRAKSRD